MTRLVWEGLSVELPASQACAHHHGCRRCWKLWTSRCSACASQSSPGSPANRWGWSTLQLWWWDKLTTEKPFHLRASVRFVWTDSKEPFKNLIYSLFFKQSFQISYESCELLLWYSWLSSMLLYAIRASFSFCAPQSKVNEGEGEQMMTGLSFFGRTICTVLL